MLTTKALDWCFDALLGVLGPRLCAICAAPAEPGPPGLFCASCGVPASKAPATRELGGLPVVAWGPYASPLADAVKQLKYAGRTDVVQPLAILLATALEQANLEGDELFVPVPLHPHRLAQRGYNQAALLARASARALRARRPGSSFRALPCALSRIVDTPQQALLEREARALNVRRAFRPSPRARLSGRSLVLVDDVVTTGATALACIESLKESGARVVLIAAVCTATAC